MRSHPVILSFLLGLFACGAPGQPQTAKPNPGFQWLADDYPAALAAARAAGKPLFIDMWAPWCHTCLAMKHHVFSDPGLSHHGMRFVWLAIDTDKEKNAAVVAKFPPGPWPKFYVIDPKDESILATHEGSASVKQLRDLFDAAESGTGPSADGDRLSALGEHTAAAMAYRTALHSRQTQTHATLAVKYMAALVKAKDRAECERGVEAMEFAAEDHTASAADFASIAMDCASKAQMQSLVTMVKSVLDDPAAPLSIDDRTDGMRILRELHLALGEKPKADVLAEAEYAILRGAVAKAPDAGIAMTYNWPLCEVAVYLGKGADIIPILEKSVEALPTEYDPPYRLAWLYEKLGQRDKAKPLADIALERAYGPRKKRIQDFRDALSK